MPQAAAVLGITQAAAVLGMKVPSARGLMTLAAAEYRFGNKFRRHKGVQSTECEFLQLNSCKMPPVIAFKYLHFVVQLNQEPRYPCFGRRLQAQEVGFTLCKWLKTLVTFDRGARSVELWNPFARLRQPQIATGKKPSSG